MTPDLKGRVQIYLKTNPPPFLKVFDNYNQVGQSAIVKRTFLKLLYKMHCKN